MERRRKAARPGPPGGVARSLSSTPRATEVTASSPAWAHIQEIIESGGQIMLGTLAPISGAAVAHDGKKTLAMLRRRPGEAVPELLTRLDAAIATAKSTGVRMDEINVGSSDTRYEF
jgi:hypothetical protein